MTPRQTVSPASRPGTTRRAIAAAALLAASTPLPAQPPASLVRVDAVRSEPLSQTVPVIGRLVARQEGNVAARVQGAIESFPVRVGERVAAGDLIAQIEESTLKATRDLAQGRLDEARARIATAQAQLGLARQERERLAALKTTQATSKALYDDAAQSEVIATARVREAQAAVGTAQAELRRARIDLEHARVLAPYAGVIVERMLEEGAYARTGDPVVRVIGDADMEVEADVPYDRLAGLSPGVEVSATLDDGTRHPAKVRAVIPQENRLTRTRAVRFTVALNGAGGRLADGQTATVHVPLGIPREVVSVHKDGINRNGDEASVYVVIDGAAQVRPVRLGEALGNRFEVLSGLEPGERVVVRGNERLRPGDKVRITNGEGGSSS